MMQALVTLANGIAVFVEREAGHALLSLALILAGAVMVDPAMRAQLGHDIIVFALGVLSRSMGSPRS